MHDEHDLLSLKTPTTQVAPMVSVIMGSDSDWPTMQLAHRILDDFNVPHECLVVSAHRTPKWMAHFAEKAESRGIQAIIAGAGGAAHLPGMVAAQTTVPVLGVPIKSATMNGLDSLYSIVQMPAGTPTATFAIGEAGAKNAALFAVAMLANSSPELKEALKAFRAEQTERVLNINLDVDTLERRS
jgi:5-(carboxyamino)imidazole ribonucleotide mutase